MLLTKQAAKVLKESIAEKPLQEGEIRHIETMGGLYITATRLDKDHDIDLDKAGEVVEVRKDGMKYWYQYAVRFGNKYYYMYAGVLDTPAAD